MAHAQERGFNIVAVLIVIAVLAIVVALFVRFANPSGYFLNNAGASYNGNDLDGTVSKADTVLTYDPHDVDALLLKAEALAQKGSLTFQERTYGLQAIDLANQALAIDPKSDEAYRIIGYAHEIMQEYDQAHTAYQEALSINPQNALAVADDAHAWDLQGKTDRAKAEYQQALNMSWNLDVAQMGLGRILFREGDLHGASVHFSEVYQDTRNVRLKAEAAYCLGVVDSLQTDAVSSEQHFRDATTIDPSYPLGWAGLGSILFNEAAASTTVQSPETRAQHAQESITDLLRAINLNPNQSAAHLQLGIEMAALGQTKNALIILNGTKDIVPKDITLSAPDKQAMLANINSALGFIASSTKK